MIQILLEKMKLGSFLVTAMVTLTSPFTFAASGGNNGGGGNTLNGKPIEAYAGDIRKYPTYKSVIQPMLENLNETLPEFAVDLKSTIDDKVWYFVPAKLDELPREVTGIQFATEQVIIQTKNSVWVDQKKFDLLTKTPGSQETLILHELVMGALIQHTHHTANEEDHESVRAVTVYLLQNKNIDAVSLRQKLSNAGFAYYAVAPRAFVGSQNPLKDLYEYLQLSTSNGANSGYASSNFSCESHFSYDDSNVKISIAQRPKDSPSDGQAKILEINLSAVNRTSFAYDGYIFYNFIEGDSSGRQGEIRHGIQLKIAGDLIHYGIGFAECKSLDGAGKCQWQVLTDNEAYKRHFDRGNWCDLE